MESVRSALAGSGFRFQPSWARILSGDKEGLFAWVGYNYAAGTLQARGCRDPGGRGSKVVCGARVLVRVHGRDDWGGPVGEGLTPDARSRGVGGDVESLPKDGPAPPDLQPTPAAAAASAAPARRRWRRACVVAAAALPRLPRRTSSPSRRRWAARGACWSWAAPRCKSPTCQRRRRSWTTSTRRTCRCQVRRTTQRSAPGGWARGQTRNAAAPRFAAVCESEGHGRGGRGCRQGPSCVRGSDSDRPARPCACGVLAACPPAGLSKRAALYTHSFLGFGADVAFRNASGLKDASGSNPCLPKGCVARRRRLTSLLPHRTSAPCARPPGSVAALFVCKGFRGAVTSLKGCCVLARVRCAAAPWWRPAGTVTRRASLAAATSRRAPSCWPACCRASSAATRSAPSGASTCRRSQVRASGGRTARIAGDPSTRQRASGPHSVAATPLGGALDWWPGTDARMVTDTGPQASSWRRRTFTTRRCGWA